MSTTFAAPEAAAAATPSRMSVPRQRSIDDIITAARERPSLKGALWPASVTSLLLWMSFTPVDFGPLAWGGLVPLMQMALLPRLTRRVYGALYVAGALFWFPTLQWMRLGDPTMYVAWIALAVYLAFYFPVFVGLTRTAIWRFKAPVWLAAPIVWVGLEFVRAHLMTGFAWYLLGHTQYRWAAMIQISDLVGAYGVSFVVVAVNAAVATVVPMTWLARAGLVLPEDREAFQEFAQRRRPLVGIVATVGLAAAAWGYGAVRLNQSDFQAGPRVALVQGNFTTSVKHDPDAKKEIYAVHRTLMGETIPHQPDVIVWPETMYPFPLFQMEPDVEDVDLETAAGDIPIPLWKDDRSRANLEQTAEEVNAALVIGVDAFVARRDGYSHFNSAAFITPEKGLSDRYDKIHRVPFGEYIPLRETFPFLHRLTPYGSSFGIAAGSHVHLFQHKDWTMLPLICFEDTVPHLVRSMAATAGKEKRGVDILVNLTNDGWFHGSSELDQHLITAQFRCIENRMPMVRAVNTGISAFIDGNGAVRDPETIKDLDAALTEERPARTTIRDPETGRYYKQWNAAFVSTVPLDPRMSLYQRFGDWFAVICTAACVILCVAPLWRNAAKSRAGAAS